MIRCLQALARCVALLLFVVPWGCGEEEVLCKVGERPLGDKCVPATGSICGPGTVLNLVNGKCETVASDTAAADADASASTDTTAQTDATEPEDAVDALTGTDATPDSAETDTATADVCAPTCAVKDACGDDGCGGSCGTCTGEASCQSGVCVVNPGCLPVCTDKECGDNGCGGSCGTCGDPTKPLCEAGKCVAKCVPNCLGKACGDDGCGGTCGSCATGLACVATHQCVPTDWTCDTAKYAAEDQCDCACGAVDPDCALLTLATLGCSNEENCVTGTCQPKVPVAWTCAKPDYGNGGVCNCACGAPDPDCVAGAPLVGCATGEVCAAGLCGACVPDCTGKMCGDNGCGGSCGNCPEPATTSDPQLACVAGQCVDGCAPTPVVCNTNSCGDDGCGGTCGTCAPGAFCNNGQCAPLPGQSCAGNCKGKAPGGCSCEGGCIQSGDCCFDFVAQCTCEPQCDGKNCGPDGCGGSCGACLSGTADPYCGANGQCGPTCAPQCTGLQCGDDGCGGTCGTCSAGSTCADSGQCVPDTWSCADYYYKDGSACDCACGAPDPDCLQFALTNGCPGAAKCNTTSGYCDVAYCNAHSDCKAPQWCVGHYPAGGGLRKGICQVPNPFGQPEGQACFMDSDCAGQICAGGRCRAPCQTDNQCDTGAACVGIPIIQGLTGKPMGVVTVCESPTKLGAVCTGKASCGAGQVCLAVISPGNLSAQYRCGVLPAGAQDGDPCDGPGTCPVGLVCASGQCMRPCPGGNGDCLSGTQCGSAVLHPGQTTALTDDVTVPTCVLP